MFFFFEHGNERIVLSVSLKMILFEKFKNRVKMLCVHTNLKTLCFMNDIQYNISSNLYYNLDPIQHQILRSFQLNILVAWRALKCYTYLNNSFFGYFILSRVC